MSSTYIAVVTTYTTGMDWIYCGNQIVQNINYVQSANFNLKMFNKNGKHIKTLAFRKRRKCSLCINLSMKKCEAYTV